MKLSDDPGIERVRLARHRISEDHENDPRKLVAHYIELQKKHQGRLLKKSSEETPAEPANA